MHWTKDKIYLVSLFVALIISIVLILYFNRTCAEKYENNRKILILHTGGKCDEKLSNDIVKYNPLLDSASVTPRDWVRIARDITKRYHDYDAFVIVHGLDTIAYTASALSFMMENLNKTIILTNDHIPASILIAKKFNIPEIIICSNGKIFRGCRSTVTQNISSPRFPSLGDFDKLNEKLILDIPQDSYKLSPINYKNKVVVVKLFPGINSNFINGVTRGQIQGIVIDTYNTGNAPLNKKLLHSIHELSKRGVVIVSVANGTNSQIDSELEHVGVISGLDMTVEATFAKIYFIISHLKNPKHKLTSKLIQSNMRGELTTS